MRDRRGRSALSRLPGTPGRPCGTAAGSPTVLRGAPAWAAACGVRIPTSAAAARKADSDPPSRPRGPRSARDSVPSRGHATGLP
ncbi:hypothetical protein GCM10023085_20420 [Actinomadura viridis]|uniref:Uncharacterized protein n=1 Tax=Actinomadura viridis TaxID=58110 RepID=A0A931DKG5_9ACTN|nr:hypothetical protein [Actinomadura viridis]MBG6089201.1 hypothetical protein [Actinomadura viridis]